MLFPLLLLGVKGAAERKKDAARAGEPETLDSLDAIDALLKVALSAGMAGRYQECQRLAARLFLEADLAVCKNYLLAAGNAWLESVRLPPDKATAARKLIAEAAELAAAEKFAEALSLLRQAGLLGKDAPDPKPIFGVLLLGIEGASEERRQSAQYKALVHRGVQRMAEPDGKEEARRCFEQALALLPNPPRTEAERKVRGRLEAMLQEVRPAGAPKEPDALDFLKAQTEAALKELQARRRDEAEKLMSRVFLEVDLAACKQFLISGGEVFLESIAVPEAQATAARQFIAASADLVASGKLAEALPVLEQAAALGLGAREPNPAFGLLVLGLRGAVARPKPGDPPVSAVMAPQASARRGEYKAGEMIDQKYLIHSVLGRGGFGVVYKAHDRQTNCVCAVKTFLDEYLADAKAREQFRQEAQIWVNLGFHPYLVRARAVWEFQSRLYLDMEFIAPDRSGVNTLEGRLEEAVACYERALAIDPRRAYTWHNKGTALRDLEGRGEEAIAAFRQAVAIEPLLALSWIYLGECLGNSGRPAEALVAIEKALALEPKNAGVWSDKGAALEALGCLEEALKIDPKLARGWRNRGTTLAALGKLAEAADSLREAVKLAPQRAPYWRDLCITFQRMGRAEDALACALNLVDLDPSHPQGRFLAGNLYWALEKPAEALPHLDALLAMKEKPKRFALVSWHAKGECLQALGRRDEALACYSEALELDPSYRPAAEARRQVRPPA